MSRKIRKKKNNNHERAYKLSKSFTRKYAVVRINADPCRVLDLDKNRVILRPSTTITNQLMKIAHKWTVMLIVGCTESNGKFKMVTDQITFSDRRTHAQLSDYLGNEHQTMLEQCSKNMKINYVGWIGTLLPDTDFTLEATEEMFQRLHDHSIEENKDSVHEQPSDQEITCRDVQP
jgi:hypothetical protein